MYNHIFPSMWTHPARIATDLEVGAQTLEYLGDDSVEKSIMFPLWSPL